MTDAFFVRPHTNPTRERGRVLPKTASVPKGKSPPRFVIRRRGPRLRFGLVCFFRKQRIQRVCQIFQKVVDNLQQFPDNPPGFLVLLPVKDDTF